MTLSRNHALRASAFVDLAVAAQVKLASCGVHVPRARVDLALATVVDEVAAAMEVEPHQALSYVSADLTGGLAGVLLDVTMAHLDVGSLGRGVAEGKRIIAAGQAE